MPNQLRLFAQELGLDPPSAVAKPDKENDPEDPPASGGTADADPAKPRGRRPLPSHLKRQRIEHDLEPQEKHCAECDHTSSPVSFDLKYAFRTFFQFQMSDPNSQASDGIAFVVQAEGANAHWSGRRDSPATAADVNDDGILVELMRRPILNHTKRGELVYEPFLGCASVMCGTTGYQSGRQFRRLWRSAALVSHGQRLPALASGSYLFVLQNPSGVISQPLSFTVS